jgi:hypothetical protein
LGRQSHYHHSIRHRCQRCNITLTYEKDEIQIRHIKSYASGASKVLIEFIVDFVKENGLTLIAQDVSSKSISFWEKLGFEPIGMDDDYLLMQ